MKQAKRNTSAAAPEQSADAGMAAGELLLPDAEYVERLLAASTPAASDRVVEDQVEVKEVESEVLAPTGVLSLPAQCLLRDAVEYRQHLLNAISVKSVTVDVAAVERIDAAFMQVLLAFVRSRSRDCEPLAWLNVNSVFTEATRLLGVQGALALPEAA